MILITPEYLREQQLLHAAPRGYGGGGARWAKEVADLGRGLECRSVLDYGCGQGTLGEALKIEAGDWIQSFQAYDPVTAPALPDPADLVVCTDVLEHIEPACIQAVLDHLRSLMGQALFVSIGLRPTDKVLSDGRQMHIMLKPYRWWRAEFRRRDCYINPLPDLCSAKQWVAVILPRTAKD